MFDNLFTTQKFSIRIHLKCTKHEHSKTTTFINTHHEKNLVHIKNSITREELYIQITDGVVDN